MTPLDGLGWTGRVGYCPWPLTPLFPWVNDDLRLKVATLAKTGCKRPLACRDEGCMANFLLGPRAAAAAKGQKSAHRMTSTGANTAAKVIAAAASGKWPQAA